MSFAPTSRYAVRDNPPKYQDVTTNEAWLGTRVPLVLPPADDDHYVRARPGERPDQIAARVPGWREAFGDDACQLWHVIADQPDNQIHNPFADFTADKLLRCPSADRVSAALGT